MSWPASTAPPHSAQAAWLSARQTCTSPCLASPVEPRGEAQAASQAESTTPASVAPQPWRHPNHAPHSGSEEQEWAGAAQAVSAHCPQALEPKGLATDASSARGTPAGSSELAHAIAHTALALNKTPIHEERSDGCMMTLPGGTRPRGLPRAVRHDTGCSR